jgi:negative regulator of replication initiation
MNLKDLKNLNIIETKLTEIRGLLNPEDAPYICDTIVTNIGDEELVSLIEEMMKKMGYTKKMIDKIEKIVNKIQA